MDTNYVTREFGMYANESGGPGPALMGADTLLGNDVYNNDGEDLGDVKELMIDMASGTVAYAVLSYGGLLGMGGQALYRALVGADAGHCEQALHAERTGRCSRTPGFDKDHWPSMPTRPGPAACTSSTARPPPCRRSGARGPAPCRGRSSLHGAD